MNSARQLLTTLAEMAVATWAQPEQKNFKVVYDAVTPKGTRSRFSARSTITNLHMAKSETAVRSYLKSRHPQCDIQIVSLDFTS